MEQAPQSGTLLSERYRLIRPLARGGMGSVWRAEHLALSSEVAVKIIDPVLAHLDMGLPRFLREARALAALHSPYVVQVIDFGSHGPIVYLVMELLEGKTLGQRLRAEGRLSAAETHRILSDVCKAMSHAHERGIVHRDLKPDNIFLCDASRDHVTKVLDFGIAKPTGLDAASNTETGSGAFLGTPSYMSPEQCRGLEVDQRSDLWALGAIAYECLLGQRLFAGDMVGDVVVRICSGELPITADSERLPSGFGAWLENAMSRDPGARFQSAAQLFTALSAVLDGAEKPARGVDSAETLADRRPPELELVQSSESPSASSTLANGSLERTAGRSDPRTRAPVRIAAGGLLVIAIVASVAFLRRPTSSPKAAEAHDRPAEHRAGSVPTSRGPVAVVPAAMPQSLNEEPAPASNPMGGRSGTRRDGGLATPLGPQPAQPGGVQKKSPVSGPLRPPARHTSKRSSAPQNTPHEIRLLRRKR